LGAYFSNESDGKHKNGIFASTQKLTSLYGKSFGKYHDKHLRRRLDDQHESNSFVKADTSTKNMFKPGMGDIVFIVDKDGNKLYYYRAVRDGKVHYRSVPDRATADVLMYDDITQDPIEIKPSVLIDKDIVIGAPIKHISPIMHGMGNSPTPDSVLEMDLERIKVITGERMRNSSITKQYEFISPSPVMDGIFLCHRQ
jgi:hypothetical protein